MKYYAVKIGNNTGVFESWAECQNATKGYPGAVFKSFASKEEAEAFVQDRDLWEEIVAKDNEEGFLVAFTDGSYNEDLKRYSYGVFFIRPDGTSDSIFSYGSNEKYIDNRNIIGEVFGVINALDWAVSNGFYKLKIYHDYEGLSKWINGDWKAKSPASKLLVDIWKAKYEGVVEVCFSKVPGHSNVSFNEKADGLAKLALVNLKKQKIKGDEWFTIPYFDKEDFTAFADLITEANNTITYVKENKTDKTLFRFTDGQAKVVVSVFNTANHRLLVQGKNSYLMQVVISTLVELEDSCNVENILGSAYRLTIDKKKINSTMSQIDTTLPSNYPASLKRLIRQAIINLQYYVECEDYTQYAFPALRALEGHIKYLINSVGGKVDKTFSCFNRDSVSGRYSYSPAITDLNKKQSIDSCYNYYKAQRDTAFHFGDIIGNTDGTRLINTKEEADEIIKKCIQLINEQQ